MRGGGNGLKLRWNVWAVGGASIGVAFLLGRATADNAPVNPSVISVPSALAKNPIGKDEPFHVYPLAQGQDTSISLVRAQKELRPHYHDEREEVAYVVKGGGTMLLGDQKRPVKAGDIIHIPRHVVHGFVNGSKGETVVISVMSPPFDGKDRHFLTPEEEAKLKTSLTPPVKR